MADQQQKIKLIAKDGTVFEVLQEVAFQSHTIKEMCESMGYYEDFEMDVSEADGNTLKKIVEYYTVFRGDFKPKGANESKRIELTAQQKKFLDVPDDFLVDIILAADFLNIPGLLQIATQKMANLIEGKKPHEIRQIYMLPDDLNTETRNPAKKTFEGPQTYQPHVQSANHWERPQARARQPYQNNQYNQQNQYYQPMQFNHFIPQNQPVMYNQYVPFNHYAQLNQQNQFNQQYHHYQPQFVQFNQVHQFAPIQNNRPILYNQQNQYLPRNY